MAQQENTSLYSPVQYAKIKRGNSRDVKGIKKPNKIKKMADRTGLEPATSGVTGRHSNQLNYRSIE